MKHPNLPADSKDAGKDQPKNAVPKKSAGENELDNESVNVAEAEPRMTIDDHPYLVEDSDPLQRGSTSRKFERHISDLHSYSDKMFTVYNRTLYEGAHLWNQCRNAFRPHYIKDLSRPMATEWTEFLVHRW